MVATFIREVWEAMQAFLIAETAAANSGTAPACLLADSVESKVAGTVGIRRYNLSKA
jgi:hypothetical protein